MNEQEFIQALNQGQKSFAGVNLANAHLMGAELEGADTSCAIF